MAVEVAVGSPASGIGTFSPAWPAHQADDIGIMVVESSDFGGLTLDTANGFETITGGIASASGTTLQVFIARATSGAMSAPTLSDPANHGVGYIIRLRGLDSGTALADLIDVIASATKDTASTSASAPGLTTTVDGAYVMAIISRADDLAGAGFSDWANSDLTGGTEIADDGTASGNGGGIAVFAGTKTTAGSVGVTTATCASTTNASITLALDASGGETPYSLSVDSASAVIAGQAVEAQYAVGVGSASAVGDGQNVSLLFDEAYVISLSHAQAVVEPQSIPFILSKLFDDADVVVQGQTINLLTQAVLPVEAGQATVAGQGVTLTFEHILPVVAAQAVVRGSIINLIANPEDGAGSMRHRLGFGLGF